MPTAEQIDVEAIRAELDRRLDHKSRSRSGREDSRYDAHLDLVPRIECASGLKMSVQASEFYYCAPRESVGPWHSVEVGFPTRRVAALANFAEDPKRLTKTVYGWVPVEVVAQVIADNGGFKPLAKAEA